MVKSLLKKRYLLAAVLISLLGVIGLSMIISHLGDRLSSKSLLGHITLQVDQVMPESLLDVMEADLDVGTDIFFTMSKVSLKNRQLSANPEEAPLFEASKIVVKIPLKTVFGDQGRVDLRLEGARFNLNYFIREWPQLRSRILANLELMDFFKKYSLFLKVEQGEYLVQKIWPELGTLKIANLIMRNLSTEGSCAFELQDAELIYQLPHDKLKVRGLFIGDLYLKELLDHNGSNITLSARLSEVTLEKLGWSQSEVQTALSFSMLDYKFTSFNGKISYNDESQIAIIKTAEEWRFDGEFPLGDIFHLYGFKSSINEVNKTNIKVSGSLTPEFKLTFSIPKLPQLELFDLPAQFQVEGIWNGLELGLKGVLAMGEGKILADMLLPFSWSNFFSKSFDYSAKNPEFNLAFIDLSLKKASLLGELDRWKNWFSSFGGGAMPQKARGGILLERVKVDDVAVNGAFSHSLNDDQHESNLTLKLNGGELDVKFVGGSKQKDRRQLTLNVEARELDFSSVRLFVEREPLISQGELSGLLKITGIINKEKQLVQLDKNSKMELSIKNGKFRDSAFFNFSRDVVKNVEMLSLVKLLPYGQNFDLLKFQAIFKADHMAVGNFSIDGGKQQYLLTSKGKIYYPTHWSRYMTFLNSSGSVPTSELLGDFLDKSQTFTPLLKKIYQKETIPLRISGQGFGLSLDPLYTVKLLGK